MVLVEYALAILFLGLWIAAWLVQGVLATDGPLALDLYRFYSVGAVLGWVTGNVYVLRRRTSDARWRLLMLYLFGPPASLFLLRAMAPSAMKAAAPLVPVYGFVVYVIFFLVPVTFRGKGPPRRPRIGSDS